MTPIPNFPALAPTAARQHGVFTVAQAHHAGVTKASLDRRIRTGEIVAVDYGVYRSVLTPVTWHQRLLAACLAGPAVASHRSGGALWSFPLTGATNLEVTALRHRRRHRGEVVWHESYLLDERDVTEIDGIPVTSAARTVADLAAVLDTASLQRVVDDALRRRLATVESLERLLERLGPRRIGAAALDAALAARSGRAVPESDLETQFELLVRTHDLPVPTPQWPVRTPDGRRLRIDFAYPQSRVGIELMGSAVHAPPDRWADDLDRLGVLTAMGWHMLLFSYEQVTSRPATVVEAIEWALDRPARRDGPPVRS